MVIALLLSAACRSTYRADAEALGVRGKGTGERLAAYYESLARDTVDQWELTAFRRGFLRLPEPDTDSRKQFETQYAAFRSRARMARRLGNVYEAFGSLASYDTGGKIMAEIEALDDELKDVTDNPLLEGRTGDVFDRLVRAIASWKQNRELRPNEALLAETAEGVRALFRAERELYRDIARDRADKYRQIATDLVEAKEVVSAPLVDRVLSSYGLEWPSTKEPFTDERTIAGIKELIEARAKTFEAQAQSETDGVAAALSALVRAHEGLP